MIFYIFLYGLVSSTLRFHEDGTFKILQVTDIHYQKGAESECKDILPSPYPCNKIYDLEKPDFVAFTGDQIDWGCEDAEKGMDACFEGVIANKIPWAGVLGNHDGESEGGKYGRKAIVQYMSTKEFSLTELGPDEAHGYGNFKIPILDSKEVERFDMFFFDSGANDHYLKYDYIHKSQLDWFQSNSVKNIPNVVFFHIPLRETRNIIDFKLPIIGDEGDRPEYYWSSLINAGAYLTFLEHGNVKAIINGHCHITDFCGSLVGDMQLCFGGAVDYDVYGQEGWPRRTRVIQLEDFGRIAYTWKRLDDQYLSKKDFQILWNITDKKGY